MDVEIERIDKEIAEAHKVGKKVYIGVLALPIIGVAVLAALGGLSYQYNVLSPKILVGKYVIKKNLNSNNLRHISCSSHIQCVLISVQY